MVPAPFWAMIAVVLAAPVPIAVPCAPGTEVPQYGTERPLDAVAGAAAGLVGRGGDQAVVSPAT